MIAEGRECHGIHKRLIVRMKGWEEMQYAKGTEMALQEKSEFSSGLDFPHLHHKLVMPSNF